MLWWIFCIIDYREILIRENNLVLEINFKYVKIELFFFFLNIIMIELYI